MRRYSQEVYVQMPEVVFRPKRGAHRITVSRSRLAPPEVTYPRSMSLEMVRREVEGSDFYRELLRMAQNSVGNPMRSGYRTRCYTFTFSEAASHRLTASVSGGTVHVLAPRTLPMDSYAVQHFAFRVLKDLLRTEARSLLPGVVAREAERWALQYRSVRVNEAKNRWGSCSSQGNLNYSLHCMLLPDDLLRYVLLHELAHLVYLNHGDAFWELLDRMVGGSSRSLDARLNAFQLDIPKLY